MGVETTYSVPLPLPSEAVETSDLFFKDSEGVSGVMALLWSGDS
jgi:hypothetical protein